MSVINPESDVWQAVKVSSRPLGAKPFKVASHTIRLPFPPRSQYPMLYISTNWPIRYASISSDGKLIAISGRYRLTHFPPYLGGGSCFVTRWRRRKSR